MHIVYFLAFLLYHVDYFITVCRKITVIVNRLLVIKRSYNRSGLRQSLVK